MNNSDFFTEVEIELALRLLRKFPEGTPGGGWTAWEELKEYFLPMSLERKQALYDYAIELLKSEK